MTEVTESAGDVLVVAGFGRCGSTLVMRMLRAGGVPWSPGSSPGSGEHVDNVGEAARTALPGHAVKLLDPAAPGFELPSRSFRCIWLDRDPVQQSRSWAKFCGLMGFRPSLRQQYQIRQDWHQERPAALALLGRDRPVVRMSFETLLTDPGAAADLAPFTGLPDLDVSAMAAVVDSRSPNCAPDLTTELRYASECEVA